MELSYLSGHGSCQNHITGSRPPVEVICMSDGKEIGVDTTETEIVFMMSGKLRFSYGNVKDRFLPAGQFVIFPPGVQLFVQTAGDIHAVVLRIRQHVQLCAKYSLENLFSQYQTGADDENTALSIHGRIGQYIVNLNSCMDEGLRCKYYFELKLKELFLLLKNYYTGEELACFFSPLASSDMRFAEFIRKNYRKARNVTELAGMANHSLSKFKIKFKNAFGMPALAWLTRQKMHNVYNELVYSDKSLKEISEEYHFASVSHLSIFCKEKLAMPPGKIRQLEKKDNGLRTMSESTNKMPVSSK